jgi:hypothetical protein
MKRNNGISPIVWSIGVIGIAITGFFAWMGLHAHRISAPQTQPAPAAEEISTAPAASPASPTPIGAIVAGLPPVIPIPLTDILVPAENGSWIRDKDYLLAPHAPREFGGVRFLLDGMIQLQSQGSKDRNRDYRTSVLIPINLTNRIGSIHLLGGTRYGEQQKAIAQIVWHYEDGSTSQTPIANLTHFRDWVRNPYEQPAHLPYAYSKVVWAVPQANRTLRLYRTTLANPAPKKSIKAIEFVSEMQEPTLFLVGVTLDPLKPGERPDNTADLEPADPVPPRTVQIAVSDATGLPLPNSRLQVQYELRIENKMSRSSSSFSTDAQGLANVGYPPQDLSSIDISASHENYAGRKINWNLQTGDVIPASYTLKLTGDVTIGAIVVDAENNPVPDATVSLYRFWSGGEDSPNRKGEQADFRNQKQTTGPDGHWRATGLPAELLDHIGFGVTHSNYIGTNYNVSGNFDVEKQLRAETLKIVLHGGLGASGLVTDENDNPIANASVWAGRKFSRERQNTKTDAQGRFRFQNVSEGDVLFSVIAGGRQPEAKTFTVKSDMPEIVFKLKPGHEIRGLVQDDGGVPIPDVRVSLEGSPGESSYDAFEFSANTDSNGKFVWDGAPAGTLKYYVGKQGYEQKRNIPLAPDQDNVITLRAPRRLQGLVLDAKTGQAVTKFSIRTGRRSSPSQSQVYGVIRNTDFNSADGQFSVTIDEADDNAVQVWGDDYSMKTESFPDGENSVIELTVRLDPALGLKGIVTTSAGVPVPGANVIALSGDPGMSVQLLGSHLRSYDQRAKVATTDEQGAFSLGAVPESGTVVAAADIGFGSASIDEVRSSQVIVLQTFGRIEGSLKIAGSPAAGEDVLYNPTVTGLMADFNSFKATTDEAGHFSIERVPPGEGSIVRLIKTGVNMWTHSHNTPITVEPGKTTQINLGDTGAVLRGTVRFQVPPTNDVKLAISGNLSGGAPRLPAFNSPAETQAYINSPEWKAQMRVAKNYAFKVTPDGAFQIDSVVPGSYSLRVSAQVDGDRPWMNSPVAEGNISVTVPDNANPLNPISIGEVPLSPIAAR